MGTRNFGNSRELSQRETPRGWDFLGKGGNFPTGGHRIPIGNFILIFHTEENQECNSQLPKGTFPRICFLSLGGRSRPLEFPTSVDIQFHEIPTFWGDLGLPLHPWKSREWDDPEIPKVFPNSRIFQSSVAFLIFPKSGNSWMLWEIHPEENSREKRALGKTGEELSRENQTPNRNFPGIFPRKVGKAAGSVWIPWNLKKCGIFGKDFLADFPSGWKEPKDSFGILGILSLPTPDEHGKTG